MYMRGSKTISCEKLIAVQLFPLYISNFAPPYAVLSNQLHHWITWNLFVHYGGTEEVGIENYIMIDCAVIPPRKNIIRE